MHFDFELSSHAKPTSSQVQAQAARSVALLNAIEATVSRCTADAAIIAVLNSEFAKFLEYLRTSEPEGLLDPEGRACDLFEQGSNTALRLYNKAVERREHARRDTRLTGEDGVEDAYTELIAELADFHNVLEDIRDSMATIDSERSKVVGSANTADDLLAQLKA
jgi:hypothetical protein